MELQKHDDYQESVNWLLGFIEDYSKHGRTLATAGKEHGEGVTTDENLKRATRQLRTLLERFANGVSLDFIIDAINDVIDVSKKDTAFSEWFETVDVYVRKVLLEPGYVLEPDCNSHANRLRETGRQFYDEKYRTQFDKLFNSIATWFKAFGDDPVCFSNIYMKIHDILN